MEREGNKNEEFDKYNNQVYASSYDDPGRQPSIIILPSPSECKIVAKYHWWYD